jgi:tetratricopeptide (TPR) repeat protein
VDTIDNLLRNIGLEIYRARFNDAEIEPGELPALTDLQLKKKPLSIEDASHRASILSAIRLLPGNSPAVSQAIFISYPHQPPEHAELAQEIYDRLRARGHRPWFDKKDIGTGTQWRERITRGILESDWVIACLSSHSVRDPGVCLNELGIALNQKSGDESLRTVLLENGETARPPMSLTHVQWLDLTAFDSYRPKDLHSEEQMQRWNGWLDTQIDKLIVSIESRSSLAGDIDYLKKRLIPAGFIAEIAHHSAGFSGRKWLFEGIERWCQDKRSQPVLWIKGPAGIGKSAIAAQLAHRERSMVLGIHFCKWNDATTHDAANLVRTMAFQIASRHPDYRMMLLSVIDSKFPDDRMINAGWQELYRELIANLVTPNMAIDAGRERHLIVIDGLDEARRPDGRNEILDLISEFKKLPQWLGVVVTSRPEQDIVSRLNSPYELDAQSEQNRQDVSEFLKEEFKAFSTLGSNPADLDEAVEVATDRSDGIMLYAAELLRGIREGAVNPQDSTNFPYGLNGIFDANMQRVCPDVAMFRKKVRPLLELVAGCPLPVPEQLVRSMLDLDQDAFGAAIKPMTSLLIQRGTRDKRAWSLFHRSFGEWLISPANRHDYQMEDDGKKRIGEFLWKDYIKARKLITASRFFQEDATKGSWFRRMRRHLFGRWIVSALGGSSIHTSASLHLDSIDSILFECIDATGYWKDISGLVDLAGWYSERGRYRAAISVGTQLLVHAEQTLGPEHPDIAKRLNNLAVLYERQGRYAEAEMHILQALAIAEKVLGREHPNVAKSLNNLALLYEGQGRYAEAEPRYLQALAITEKVLGREHPDFFTRLNNLATLYVTQGRYAEAEAHHLQALAIAEEVLGREHLNVATSLSNLAALYLHQGRYAEAEPFDLRAFAILEKFHGAEHPDVAKCLNNRAVLYEKQGRCSEAESLNLRALSIQEKILGTKHPDVATSLSNLALLYQNQGRYADAEPILLQALAIREKVLGRGHPDVAMSLNNLATLLANQDRHTEAESHYQRAIAIQETIFGPEHPNVDLARRNLSNLYKMQSNAPKQSEKSPIDTNVKLHSENGDHQVTSRNSLCQCGSGLRYKLCHGKLT